jgi:hypothetical protein
VVDRLSGVTAVRNAMGMSGAGVVVNVVVLVNAVEWCADTILVGHSMVLQWCTHLAETVSSVLV